AVVPAGERLHHLVGGGGRGPRPVDVERVGDDRDDVEVLASADEVVHEVAVRAVPDRGVEPVAQEPGRGVGRDLVTGDEGSVGHLPGEGEGGGHAHRVADRRADAVGPDEHVAGEAAPVGGQRDRAGGVGEVDVDDLRPGVHLDDRAGAV